MTSRGIAPFDDAGGMWLRCALHTHTTESDGHLPPRVVRGYHAAAGYDVLAITDHDRRAPDPEGKDDLVLLGGTELSLRAPQSGGPLHLLGIGVTELPAVKASTPLPEAAAAIRAAGGVPFMAHPVWSGHWTDEFDDFTGVAGIEIYNAGCEIEQHRGYAPTHWDTWLSKGHRLGGIATDDLHTPGFEAFYGWTMVHVRERSRPAVLEALDTGRYYATTGPRIQAFERDGDQLTIRTTPARSITFLAPAPYGAQVSSGRLAPAFRAQRLRTGDGQTLEGLLDGDLLTGASINVPRGLRYGRMVVTDDQGRRAWTNPIYFNGTTK